MTTAFILAGGLGTRLRTVVSDVPKPMAKVLNRPFLEFLLDYWMAQGISKFILCVGYKKEHIIKHFGKIYKGITIKYVEEDSPLGTGGGLLLASRYLDKPFILLNGDSIFKVDLNKIIMFHEQMSSDWTICLFRANENNRYGLIKINESGQIKSFQAPKISKGYLANGGVYYISPEVLRESGLALGMKYSLEEDIIPMLIEQKRKIFGFEINSKFLDIGVPEDYQRANLFLS